VRHLTTAPSDSGATATIRADVRTDAADAVLGILERAGVALRPRLVRRGIGSLVVGLGVAGLVSAAVVALLDLFDLLPPAFSLGSIPAARTHIGAATIPVALAAGAAGILAVETRASAAVGVAISVTTIPALAYLGVGLGIGEFDRSLSALWVLLANVAMMLAGGSSTLAVQRLIASRTASAPQ